MDRGAWHATVHGGHESVEPDLATKQQQSRKKHSIFSSDAYLPGVSATASVLPMNIQD